MRTIITLIIAAGLTSSMPIQINANEPAYQHASKYAGEQTRTIKSLSASDIRQLRKGAGWGLAKAAELNGIPGPAHILELKDQIALTPEQTAKIQVIYNQMKTDAIILGNQLIAQERELEQRFQNKLPSPNELKSMLSTLGITRTQLRFVHLATHLKTPDILTVEQIASYNQLRGYESDDPCGNVPKGHDAALWKKHNGCW